MSEVKRVVTKLCRELDELQEEAKSYINTMHQLEACLQEKLKELETRKGFNERKN